MVSATTTPAWTSMTGSSSKECFLTVISPCSVSSSNRTVLDHLPITDSTNDFGQYWSAVLVSRVCGVILWTLDLCRMQGRTISDFQKHDGQTGKQTDKQTKNSTFLATPAALEIRD